MEVGVGEGDGMIEWSERGVGRGWKYWMIPE